MSVKEPCLRFVEMSQSDFLVAWQLGVLFLARVVRCGLQCYPCLNRMPLRPRPIRNTCAFRKSIRLDDIRLGARRTRNATQSADVSSQSKWPAMRGAAPTSRPRSRRKHPNAQWETGKHANQNTEYPNHVKPKGKPKHTKHTIQVARGPGAFTHNSCEV